MSEGEHLLVMVDANAPTGAGGEGCVDDKVLGAYGRDARNRNERRQLEFSAESQLALVKMLFLSIRTQAWERSSPLGLYPHVATR